uniref:Uncharacterized protein n=1 Tax=Utricularia reniformis TaxID=192314 RepID=A0A1Y0B291_9LAMI|nr:hypothetical protein AEK19_MT1307 [Utricularia reniformis]ART31508.1 hypothetical protein AEK19_MT1307 [Utricularia reniformis]
MSCERSNSFLLELTCMKHEIMVKNHRLLQIKWLSIRQLTSRLFCLLQNI